MSRDLILAALQKNQPELVPLPSVISFESSVSNDLIEKFQAMAETIGSKVYHVRDFSEIQARIALDFSKEKRVVTTVDELISAEILTFQLHQDPHSYADVDVAIFKPSLAVAENSAVWLTEDLMGIRVLPFITQHIIMLVDVSAIVPDMHAAYQIIGEADYGFGTFIAGPSKTADIEQSLVLGAHGPRTMTIFMCQ